MQRWYTALYVASSSGPNGFRPPFYSYVMFSFDSLFYFRARRRRRVCGIDLIMSSVRKSWLWIIKAFCASRFSSATNSELICFRRLRTNEWNNLIIQSARRYDHWLRNNYKSIIKLRTFIRNDLPHCSMRITHH